MSEEDHRPGHAGCATAQVYCYAMSAVPYRDIFHCWIKCRCVMNQNIHATQTRPVNRMPKLIKILKEAPGAEKLWIKDAPDARAVPSEEVKELVLWFIGKVSSQRVRQGGVEIEEEILGSQTHDDQIKWLTTVERCASMITEQFSTQDHRVPAEASLYVAYRSELQRQSAEPPLAKREMLRSWNAFRHQVSADAAFLAKIATTARDTLQEQGGRRGRPAMNWRNALFTALFRRLSDLLPTSQERRVEVAMKVWNLYFPNNQIIEIDAAKKILRRTRLAKS